MNETYVYFLEGTIRYATTDRPNVKRLVSFSPLVIEPVDVRTMPLDRFREIERELAAIGAMVVAKEEVTT